MELHRGRAGHLLDLLVLLQGSWHTLTSAVLLSLHPRLGGLAEHQGLIHAEAQMLHYPLKLVLHPPRLVSWLRVK